MDDGLRLLDGFAEDARGLAHGALLARADARTVADMRKTAVGVSICHS